MAALSAVMLVVAYFVAKKYEPEVRKVIVYELNRKLNVPVQVGDINLSLLQRFPYASLRFSDVVIPQVKNGEPTADTLIYVKDMYLQMGLIDFLRKNYVISEAEINTGFFDMIFYENGSDNFHFWKTGEDSTGAAARFSITDILIRDFGYRLQNSDKLALDLLIVKSKASGDFGSDIYTIESESDMWIKTVAYESDTLYQSEKFSGDLNIDINRTNDAYHFNSDNLELADQEIGLTGSYIPGEKQAWNLEINAQKADLQKLTHLMPLSLRSKFAKYQARGKTDIKLKLSSGERFDLEANFNALSGRFQHNEALGTAEISGAKGRFEMRNGISSLMLDELEASIGPGDMQVWGKIIDFDAPSFDLNLEGEIDLQELKSLLNVSLLETLEGRVVLDGRLQGNLPRESTNETLDLLKGIDFIGKINLSKGVFQMQGQGQLYDEIEGDIQLKDNAVIIKSAHARVNKSPFQISGTIKNALPYISRKGQKLAIVADFKAEELNFNDILTKSESKRDTSYNFQLPKDVAFDLSLEVGKMTFRKFEATNITGNTYYKSGLLTLNPFSFTLASGSVNANVHFTQKSDTQFEAQALAHLKNIELEEFFVAFENFGQTVIQSRHLNGRANATIQFSALFKSDLSIDSESIKSNIDLMVLKGKLKNVEALQGISDYLRGNALWRSLIKVDEFDKRLKVVNFDTLSNSISIEKGMINIPTMTIGSSALTLNLSGTHGFNDAIDYSINFRINELLRTGKRDKQSEFGYVVDDNTGLRFFLKMQGTTDNPSFSLDGDAARDKRKQQFQTEKNTFKSILKEEFGLFKSDTTLTGVPDQNKKNEAIFSVDWDEFKNANDTSKKDEGQPAKKKRKNTKQDEDLYDKDDDL